MKPKEAILAQASADNQKDDFLDFVERHEMMHQINKEKRINAKELSMASTYSNSTNVKPNRPFSGDVNKKHGSKGSQVGSNNKILPPNKLIRPHSSKFPGQFMHQFDNITEQKTSEMAPTQCEEEKGLPTLEECSSRKSETEYDLSSENSNEDTHQSIDKKYEGSLIMPDGKPPHDVPQNDPVTIARSSNVNLLCESVNSNQVAYQTAEAKLTQNFQVNYKQNSKHHASDLEDMVESLFEPTGDRLHLSK